MVIELVVLVPIISVSIDVNDPLSFESLARNVAEGNEPLVVKVTVYVPPIQKCVLLMIVFEIVCAVAPFNAKNSNSISRYLLLNNKLNGGICKLKRIVFGFLNVT